MIHRTDDSECARVRVRLSRRHDGDDERPFREELDVHLAACPSCRDFELELQAISKRLRLLRSEGPPEDLWSRIASEAARAAAAGTVLARWPARVAAALLGFLGVASAELALGPSAPPDVPGELLRPFLLLASLADAENGALLPPENQLVNALRGPEEETR